MYTPLPSNSLRVSGPDRLDFVQGQMTNDIRSAPTPGLTQLGMVAACFLNVRGQLEQFARIYKRENDLYIHLDDAQAPALQARFKKYIIFDQVEIQDTTAQLSSVHVWDAESVAGWQPDGPAVQQFEFGGGMVLAARVNRTGKPGLDLHYLREYEAALLPRLGEEKPLADLDAARIAAGIPDPMRDGFMGLLPQEIGLDVGGPLPAISYRKGCYVGQEIMARLEARGNARYHLARLRGAHLPSLAEVRREGKVVGQSGLSAGSAVLVRLRKEVEDGAEVSVGDQTAPVLARVQWLADA